MRSDEVPKIKANDKKSSIDETESKEKDSSTDSKGKLQESSDESSSISKGEYREMILDAGKMKGFKPEVQEEEHPLQFRWALYHTAPRQKTGGWQKPKMVVSVSTVGDFWRVFNSLAPPSDLKTGSDMHFFKGTISPEWEHPMNVGGGVWSVRVPLDHTDVLNVYWLHMVLCMIGGGFSGQNERICGLVYGIRPRMNRLQLWVREASNKSAMEAIGRQFQLVCNGRPVGFSGHKKKYRLDFAALKK